MIKTNKKFGLLLFSLGLIICLVCAFAVTPKHLNGKTYADENIQTAFNASQEMQTTTTLSLTKVNGYAPESTSSTGANANSGYLVQDPGASNTYAFRVNFHSAVPYRNSTSPIMDNPIKIDETVALTIRIYCHLSPTSPYYTQWGGILFYSLTDNGEMKDTGYMLPGDVPQDQWYNLTLNYSDFSKLADSDGYINGIQIASVLNGGTPGVDVYAATANETYTGAKAGMYILIDNITAQVGTPDLGGGEEDEGDKFGNLEKSGNLLTAPVDGWYSIADRKLQFINGKADLDKQEPNTKNNMGSTEAGDYIVAADGAVSGYAFQWNFHSYNATFAEKAIKFKKAVDIDEIGALVIRMRAHLSASSTYIVTNGGIRLYGLNDDGMSPGYLIPTDVVQDEWIEVVLDKDQAKLLADKDGKIAGLQVGSIIKAATSDLFYMATPTQDGHAYLQIDYITASTLVDVKFVSDGNTVKETKSYTGIAINGFIPEKEGYVFCGWFNGDKLFNFNTVVTEDMTLTAKWEKVGSVKDNKGLYFNASATGNYATQGQYIYLDSEGNIDLTDVTAITPKLVGLTQANTVIVIDESFNVTEFVLGAGQFEKVSDSSVKTVTFNYGNGSQVFHIKAGKTLKEFTPERAGYTFEGWVDKSGNAFNFGSAINADIELATKWSYVEIDADLYEFYCGTFYSKETDKFLVLEGDNKATFDGKVYTYHILDAWILTLTENGVDTEFNVLPQRITDNDGNVYYRMDVYYIVFNTNGGSQIETIVVDQSCGWKVNAPENPTKDGASFTGWTTADGKAFDFSQVVTKSVTLYANYNNSEKPTPAPGDSSSGNNTLAIVLGCVGSAILGAGIALGVALIIKKRSVKK